ncbi:MAG: hypothetical protein ACOYEV_10950 [Candidatus Nanopelagicales bacterium]
MIAVLIPVPALLKLLGLALLPFSLAILASGGAYWVGISVLTPAVVLLTSNEDNWRTSTYFAWSSLCSRPWLCW